MRRIEDHALLGDGRTAALVTRDGAIDWLCWPRFDSPSVFASLLDDERGGEWRVWVPGATTERAYLPGTNVLVTRFVHDEGELEVVDFMPVASEPEKRRMLLPAHEVVRILRCTRGAVTVEVSFDPRPDYGRVVPRLERGSLGGWCFDQGGLRHLLRATFDMEPAREGGLHARLRLGAGETHHASFTGHGEVAVVPPLGDWTERRLEQTVRYWRDWVARTTYDGPHAAQVQRSVLALKLLCYAPSGAIVAAPTTSLPEERGGAANWDYRYCWLRDAAFTVRALLGLGHHDEAHAFASWLLHATRLTRPRVRVLYDVFGGTRSPERELDHLRGWGGARPVRTGNAAAEQLQLDAYGELIDAVSRVYREDALDRETSGLLRALGRFVCDNWERPDRGIWEVRGEPRAFTHSRVMSWVALDRLLDLDRRGVLRRPIPSERFAHNRELLRAQVERQGFNARLSSYTQSLDGETLDASAILLGWYGFHEPAHPRMQETASRVVERLGAGSGLLYRYEESRDVGEGAFAACSFWLVEHQASAGLLGQARRLFETLLGHANDVGLYAEEIDPRDGSALGNFPQAYTHVGLISAALALREAEARQERVARAAS